MEEQGVTSAVISLGGNIVVMGEKGVSMTDSQGDDFSIGIRDPQSDSGDLAGVLRCSDKTVVSSGTYERYFEADGKRYHHIIDPHDGYPADNGICSAVVVAEDGALADALSTALFVMGKDEAITFSQTSPLSFEAVLFCKDGTVWASSGLRPSLELNGSDFSLTE